MSSASEAEEPRLISRLTCHTDIRQTIQEYDLTASDYDETFPVDVLVGPRLVLETLDSLLPADGPTARGQLKVMDIASGTGLVGQQDVIGQHRIDVQDNTYDAAVVAGAFVPGHCPITALDEMIRICKPGGYIINTMRMEFIIIAEEYSKLPTHMKSLEDRGLWRRVSQTVTDNYYEQKQGVTFVYQKL